MPPTCSFWPVRWLWAGLSCGMACRASRAAPVQTPCRRWPPAVRWCRLRSLLNAQSYQNSSWTLLSGVAALGLFLALLGSRVLLTAVRNGYDLAARSPEGLQGAFRVRDKDLIRVLARSLDQKDPWVLLSRPVQWDEALVEQSFGERASERRARKTA